MPHRAKPVTVKPIVTPILTGHFREGPSYASWRPNGTTDWLLIYTVAGAGRVGVAGAPMPQTANPGDLVLLRPGALHDYGTAPRAPLWEILWAHFLPRPHWQDWLAAWPESAPGLVHAPLPDPERTEARRHLDEMHRHAIGGRPQWEAFAMNSLEAALLWCDRVLVPFGMPGAASRIDARILRARAYLLERLAEPVTLDELARAVGLSVSRTSHLFREELGQTPLQFLEQERMARARQLLERTTRPITAIAAEVGYESPFYFSLRFKHHSGHSPRDWRRRRQREADDGDAAARP